jgi:hypothetical protein
MSYNRCQKKMAALSLQVKEFARMLALSLIHRVDSDQNKVKRERKRCRNGTGTFFFYLLCCSNSAVLGPWAGKRSRDHHLLDRTLYTGKGISPMGLSLVTISVVLTLMKRGRSPFMALHVKPCRVPGFCCSVYMACPEGSTT